MPCYATGSAEGDARLHASEAMGEVTKLTRLLCDVAETITSRGLLDQTSKHFQKWYRSHELIDINRKKREAKETARIQLAKKAKSKLTKIERQALGLDE